MKSPYNIRTADFRNRLDGDRKSYTPNMVYESDGIYYYINSRGYYHILKAHRRVVGTDKEHCVTWFEIVDCILLPQDVLKESKVIGTFKTAQECIAKAKSMEGKLINEVNF